MSLASLYAQLDAVRRQVSANNSNISRLKTAKRLLQQSKSQLNTHRRQLASKANNSDTYQGWKGQTQSNSRGFLSDIVIAEYRSFITSVDNRLDAVCDEITRLENENYRLGGHIGYLTASINSLLNELETATN